MANVRRNGLTLLASATAADVHQVRGRKDVASIVFVHGLRGHPRGTWQSERVGIGSSFNQSQRRLKAPSFLQRKSRSPGTKKRSSDGNHTQSEVEINTNSQSNAVFWPEELLPQSINDADIYTYGYNADLVGGFFEGKGGSKNSISQYANDMVIEIASEIGGEGPIIMVTHSLGGIVVKDALRRSKFSLVESHKTLHNRTRVVMFLGTPHRGTDITGWGLLMSSIASVTLLDVDKTILQSLKVDSEILDNIQEEFLKMLHNYDFKIHSFVEGKGISGTKGVNQKVVGDFSSKIGHPLEITETIDANHMQMVRFSGSDDEGYRKVARALRSYIRDMALASAPLSAAAKLLFEKRLADAAPTGQLELIPDHHVGTLSWILQDPAYLNWVAPTGLSSNLLWVQGKVGCGKSVASKYILQHIGSLQPQPLRIYFFCNGSDERKSSFLPIMRSILHQLLAADRDILSSIGNDENDGSDVRTSLEAKQWLQHLLHEHCRAKRIYLIIDGVDEMIAEEYHELLETMIYLARMTMEASCNIKTPLVKVAVTSRPWESIRSKLWQFPTIEFREELVNSDIRCRLGQEVWALAKQENFPEDLTLQIEHELSLKSEGMFLWAEMAWNRFQNIDTMWNRSLVQHKLRELQELPRGLVPLFISILNDINPNKTGIMLYEWLLCASRPLSLTELGIAASIGPDTKSEEDLDLPFNLASTVRRFCGPFVHVRGSDQTVHLIHHSVAEFFRELSWHPEHFEADKISAFRIDLASADSRITSSCLRYLCLSSIAWGPLDSPQFSNSFSADAEYQRLCKKHPFLDFACDHWDNQVRLPLEHESSVSNPEVYVRALEFARLREYDINTPHQGRKRAIHLAVTWGWTEIIEKLFERPEMDVLALDDQRRSALHIACLWGLTKTALLLIEKGWWKAAAAVDSAGFHALHMLALQDMEHHACMILRNYRVAPPELNLWDPYGNFLLASAIKQGWLNALNIMFQLPGINFDLKDSKGRTPLHLAAKYREVDVLKGLLSNGAELNAVDLSGKTALHYAAEEDITEAISILLTAGIDCNVRDNNGSTPLHLSMANDLVRSARLLVESGADVNSQDTRGYTPFHLAAFFGDAMLVDWFLKNHGLEPSLKTFGGYSSVHMAAKGKHRSVLITFMESPRIDIAVIGRYQRNILHLIVGWADKELIERVLGCEKFKASTPDQFGMTSLHIAARDASFEVFVSILEHFIEEGGYINLADCHGRTALHLAAHMKGGRAVGELLAHGSNPNLCDKEGHTAEDLATENGAYAVLRELGSTNVAPASSPDSLQDDPDALPLILQDSPDKKVSKNEDPDRLRVIAYFCDSIWRGDATEISAWLQGTLDLGALRLAPVSFLSLTEKSREHLVCEAMDIRDLRAGAAITLELIKHGDFRSVSFERFRNEVAYEPNDHHRHVLGDIVAQFQAKAKP